MNGWLLPMFAAGTCSAGAIVLIRDLPRFAPGMPAMLTVGLYMLLGGGVLFGIAILASSDIRGSVPWPQSEGLLRIAAIGVLLGALEAFFVVGGNNKMPLPDAMIVYNLTSLVLIAAASVLLFKEPITTQRLLGLALGVASVLCLVQPATKGA